MRITTDNILRFIDRLMGWLARTLRWPAPALETPPTAPTATTTPPIATPTQSTPQTPISSPTLDFKTRRAAYHSTRVICDEMGLSLQEKNLICACIFQESMFDNDAINKNRDKNTGAVLSTDWGIVQVNDYWHIGKNKTFPSVEFVVNNPEKAVRWMINSYKHGQLKLWVSYSSGAYKRWLQPYSPMWLLAA